MQVWRAGVCEPEGGHDDWTESGFRLSRLQKLRRRRQGNRIITLFISASPVSDPDQNTYSFIKPLRIQRQMWPLRNYKPTNLSVMGYLPGTVGTVPKYR